MKEFFPLLEQKAFISVKTQRGEWHIINQLTVDLFNFGIVFSLMLSFVTASLKTIMYAFETKGAESVYDSENERG